MGSFNSVLKGFTKGFQGGYRLGLATREMNLRNYREGPPPEDTGIPDMPTGDGQVPTTSGGTDVDPTKTGSTSPSMPNAGGKGIGDQVYGYLRSKGLSHPAAAGMAGNFMQESGGDLRVISGARRGDGGASGFLGQWNGQRLKNLYAFAGSQQPTLQQQIDFALEEMNPNSPYVDVQAAKAAPAILGAKTVAEATQLFRDHFERPADPADIKPRLAYANAFADSGGGDGTFSFDGTSAAPASKPAKQAEEAPPEEEPAEEEPQQVAFVDPVPVPELPEMAVAGWETYAKPSWEDPTLYAADGGVIPDPYNPSRAFTQAPAKPTAAASFTPRRVGQAAAGTSAYTPMGSGPTPSQLAFRNRPVYQAPAPVAAPAPAPLAMDPGRGKALAKLRTLDPRGAGMQHQLRRRISQVEAMKPGDKLSPGWSNLASRWSFAGGGKVASKLEEGTRRERTMSSRGDDAGQSARDRAARRINVGASGRSSTAIDSDGYWKKGSTARKKDTALRRAKTKSKTKSKTSAAPASPTPKKPGFSPDLAVSPNRPDNRPATNAPTNNPPTVPQPRPGRLSDEYVRPAPIYEPGGGQMPAGVIPDDLAVSPNRPDNRPAMNAPTSSPPTPVRGPSSIRQGVFTRPPPGSAGIAAAPPIQGMPPAGRGRSGAPMSVPDVPGPPVVGGNPIVGTGGPAGTGGVAGGRSGIVDMGGQNAMTIGDLLNMLQGMDPNTPASALAGQGMNFAQGGVIPEDPLVSQRALSANYQTPRRRPLAPSAEAEGAEPPEGDQEEPDIEPTPRLLADVGKAIDGGIQFIKRAFGGGSAGGAIADPNAGATRQQAAARMASGEGRASPEEMEEVYNAVDPDRRMSEGQRYMTSLAKTMQWYLQNGRKDDAEGAAASLMLYGGDRFSKYGSMAGAAYNEYQKTGDRNALEDSIGYLEKAYQMIPDGGDFDIISLDEETGSLVTVHRDADGNEQQFEITPEQIPELLSQVQSSSSYWQQVARLADPEGTRQREKFKFELGQERRKSAADLAKEGRTREEWDRQHGITRSSSLEDKRLAQEEWDRQHGITEAASDEDQAAKDAAARAEWDRQHGITQDDKTSEKTAAKEEWDRQHGVTRSEKLDDEKRERAQQLEDKLLAEGFLRTRPTKPTAGQPLQAEIAPVLQTYLAAAAKAKENPAGVDQAGTALVDAVLKGGGNMKYLTDQGIWPNSDFTYLGGGAAGAAQPAEPKPEEFPDAQPGFDPNGEPGWYIPDPDRPGKFKKV